MDSFFFQDIRPQQTVKFGPKAGGKKADMFASEPVVGRCPNKRKQMLKHSKGTWHLKAGISVVITK